MTRKRILLLAGGLLAAVLAAMIAIVLLLPAERIGALAAARMEAALDRDVSIERIGLRIFPVPAVALHGLTVGGPRNGDPSVAANQALATVERLELRPRLLPLLRGRVIVNDVMVQRPTLNVEIDEAGESNLPELEPAEPDADTQTFEIHRIRVSDGQIVYLDGRDGTEVHLNGVRQRVEMTGEAPLRVDGTVRISSLSARLPALDEPVRDLPVRLSYRMAVDQASERLRVDRFEIRTDGLRLDADGTVRDWSNGLRGDLSVRTELDVGEMDRYGIAADGVQAAGRVTSELSLRGLLREPEQLSLNGNVHLAEISLTSNEWDTPVRVPEGRLVVSDAEISTENLGIFLGDSELTLDLSLRGWLPFALGDTVRAPELAFDARADRLDVAPFLDDDPDPEFGDLVMARLRDEPVNGRTAAEVAEAAGFELPEVPVGLNGRLRVVELATADQVIRDLDMTLTDRDGRVAVRTGSFRIDQDGMRVAGRLGDAAELPSADGLLPVTLEFAVDNADDGDLPTEFATLGGHLTGSARVAGTAHVQLDRYLLPERESLAGDGTFRMDGTLENAPLLRAIGQQLGIGAFDRIELREAGGRFRLDGPWIHLDEWTARTGDLDMRLTGRVGMDDSLDLNAGLDLSPRWAALADGTPAAVLVGAAADAEGRVPVGARVTGTVEDPNVALDLSDARQNLVRSAGEGVRAEVEERARDLAERAAERLPLPELPGRRTPPTDDPDEAASDTTNEQSGSLMDRLRRRVDPRSDGG